MNRGPVKVFHGIDGSLMVAGVLVLDHDVSGILCDIGDKFQ